MATAAVEREHQLAAEAIAQRMGGREVLEVPDERCVPAELELGVDAVLLRRHPQLVEARRLAEREVLLVEVGERWPAPELESFAQQPGLGRRFRLSCFLQQRSKRWLSTASRGTASR